MKTYWLCATCGYKYDEIVSGCFQKKCIEARVKEGFEASEVMKLEVMI